MLAFQQKRGDIEHGAREVRNAIEEIAHQHAVATAHLEHRRAGRKRDERREEIGEQGAVGGVDAQHPPAGALGAREHVAHGELPAQRFDLARIVTVGGVETHA